MFKLLATIDISKANGPDDNYIRREIALGITPAITRIFNQTGTLPTEWKTAHHLLAHLEENSVISPYQWGFTKGRSTTGALIDVVESWHSSLEREKDVCAVFLDLSKVCLFLFCHFTLCRGHYTC